MSFSFQYRRSTVVYVSSSINDAVENKYKKLRHSNMFAPHESIQGLEKELQEISNSGKNDLATVSHLRNILAPFFLVRQPIVCTPQTEGQTFVPINTAILITPRNEHFVTKLHWMAEILRKQTDSLGYVVYLKDFTNDSIFICPREHNLLYYQRFAWKLSEAKTIVAYAINNQECLIVNTAICDLRFSEFQGIPSLLVSNILTVPIISKSGTCYGALELYRNNGLNYEMPDLKRVNFLLMWVADAMTFNEQAVIYKRYTDINDYLLKSISDSFESGYNNEIDLLLLNILNLAKQTLDAESATIFLHKNNELYKKMTTDNDLINKPKFENLRLKKELQLANITYNSNHLFNHPDVYNDPRFDKEIDIKTGKIIRSVLATPLGADEKILFGVLQAFNKISGDEFTAIDEKFIQDIQEYCTLWLHYQYKCEALYQQNLTNQVMKNLIYQLLSKPDKVSDTFNIAEIGVIPSDFHTFGFSPYPSYKDDLTRFIFYMFTNNCTSILANNHRALYNFIYMVQRSYRPKIFYNFVLGFNAMHSIYCLLQYNSGTFNIYEIFALLVSALCFHIDSVGLTINYLHITKSPIIGQYPNSDIENHKCWLISYLLDLSRVLDKCDQNSRAQIKELIKENIFSRSVRQNLHNRLELKKIFESGEFTVKSTEHKYYLRSLIIGIANNIYLTKHPKITKYLIDCCIEECSQEYEKITIDPDGNSIKLEMIEYRQVHNEYVRMLIIPIFDLMRKISPQTEVLYVRCLECWKSQSQIIETYLELNKED